MIGNRQTLSQKQTLQQRLSPQQIQYIKLLQLPLTSLEQRVKEEMEENPMLDVLEGSETEYDSDFQMPEVDWDALSAKSGIDAYRSSGGGSAAEVQEIPRPYHESPIEALERQIGMLPLSEKDRLVAEQILGSLDADGYFRRATSSVADSIAFSHGIPVAEKDVERVLKMVQKLEPPGIGARDLRECLLLQLEALPETVNGRNEAAKIVSTEWDLFEKKHFDRLASRLGYSSDQIKTAYSCIQSLDPKPGLPADIPMDSIAVIPDFAAWPLREGDHPGDMDAVVDGVAIMMHRRNRPRIGLSRKYANMLNDVRKSGASAKEVRETEQFLKTRLESAQWFLEALAQRGDTLLAVMKTIVELQISFFKNGTGLRPMILKDIADLVGVDISTVSRIVNGKFVQTPFGTLELKFFFNEGLETASGEEVTNREIQDVLARIIREENKTNPLSDRELGDKLKEAGYPVARRTVTKYRESLGLPVARLRKDVI